MIESELLVALLKHLQLEWVAELHLAGWTAPAEPALAGPPAWSEDDAAALTRLARLGHAQGLHQTLDNLVRAHPASADRVAALRGLVERFAFTELLEQLRSEHEREPALDDAEVA